MRSIYLAAGAAGIISVFAACGGDDKPPTLADAGGTGGKKGSLPGKGDAGADEGGEGGAAGSVSHGGTSGTGGKSGDSGGTGGAGMDGDGPIVEITSPEASPDIDGEILVDSTVSVVCSVQKSDSPRAVAVDPASVRIGMQDSTGKALAEKDAVATQNAGEYSADFPLVSVPAGKVSFSCKASDKNQSTSTDSISTFVDHGPLITVSSPEPNSAHPLADLAIQFFVDPSPLSNDDDGAEVGDVTFTFDGKDFAVDEESPGKYSTSLPLYNINLFPQTPQGAITITAANTRQPKAAVSAKTYSITVDGLGPAISILAPKPQAVVGGTVTLSFTATDAGAGVDSDSVYVTLFADDPPRFFDPKKGWARNGDNFTFAFDSKLIEGKAPVQTTLNVQASDNVGNRSASGQSVQIYFDNQPPKVDLDPRNLRASRESNCSGTFDPVGPAVPNDRGFSNTGGTFEWFRVLVEEQTNDVGQKIRYFSGTQQSEVRLYVQSEPEQATTKLLVNKNPEVDDTCDDIGGIDSLVSPPLFTAMHGLPKLAEPPGLDQNGSDPPKPSYCDDVSSFPADSKRLCGGPSDLVFVPYNEYLKEPYVYVVGEPGPIDDPTCTGIDFAFLTTKQPDGWVCIAARAIDKVGNVGISPPLRVCVDDPLKDGTPACAVSSTTPPSCTDGCTPPDRGGGFTVQMK